MELLLPVILVVTIAIFLLLFFRLKSNNNQKEFGSRIDELSQTLFRVESGLKEDFRINRQENAVLAKENRMELSQGMKEFRESFERSLKDFQATFDKNVESFNQLQREKFGQLSAATKHH